MTGKVFYVGMGNCYIIVILFYINNFFSTKSLLNYIFSIYSELTDVQAEFRKAVGPQIKLPTSIGLSKKQESSRKTSTPALLTTPKPLTV